MRGKLGRERWDIGYVIDTEEKKRRALEVYSRERGEKREGGEWRWV